MNRIAALTIVGLWVFAAVHAQTPGPQTKTMPPRSPTYPTPAAQKWDPGIDKLIEDYEGAFNGGDGNAVAALFTTRAVLVGPSGELCVGRAEIQKDVTEALAGPFKGAKAALRIGRVEMVKPDVAVVEGMAELMGQGLPMTARFLSTMVREDARWRIASIAAVPQRP